MIDTFEPLCRAAQGVDLSDPVAARAELESRFDPASEEARRLNEAIAELAAAGQVADRGELPLRYGRVTKASEVTLGFSIDVVMMSAAGPLHRHPNGEVNWCIRLDGKPTFDGFGPGWAVFPPGSQHVPTVSGGTMLIVYLLPEGAIEFLQAT
jgi:hypothetical protein